MVERINDLNKLPETQSLFKLVDELNNEESLQFKNRINNYIQEQSNDYQGPSLNKIIADFFDKSLEKNKISGSTYLDAFLTLMIQLRDTQLDPIILLNDKLNGELNYCPKGLKFANELEKEIKSRSESSNYMPKNKSLFNDFVDCIENIDIHYLRDKREKFARIGQVIDEIKENVSKDKEKYLVPLGKERELYLGVLETAMKEDYKNFLSTEEKQNNINEEHQINNFKFNKNKMLNMRSSLRPNMKPSIRLKYSK